MQFCAGQLKGRAFCFHLKGEKHNCQENGKGDCVSGVQGCSNAADGAGGVIASRAGLTTESWVPAHFIEAMKTPEGMTLNKAGYLRIKKRNELRDHLAHRAYAARQMGLRVLPDTVAVDHQCGNRACWPPTDFHLVIVDQALAPFMYKSHSERAAWIRRRRKSL